MVFQTGFDAHKPAKICLTLMLRQDEYVGILSQKGSSLENQQ